MTTRLWIPSACLIVAMAGCNRDGNSELVLVPVAGTVTMDGKPLADAVVRFEPEGTATKGLTDSSGTTNADGMYVLQTPLKGAGAVVGTHKVTIRSVPPNTQAVDITRDDNYLHMQNQPKERVPDKYNDKTTLKFEVDGKGTSSANFAIQSK
ncbi:hypothetical protein TA3x_002455 [Tundrisphaera sp. TA3]|uniref:hypothetical protein n=1 Tax=Tundrisphaera sp. TA3 TaxID=3435775 RepID=UPI003EB6DB21